MMCEIVSTTSSSIVVKARIVSIVSRKPAMCLLISRNEDVYDLCLCRMWQCVS